MLASTPKADISSGGCDMASEARVRKVTDADINQVVSINYTCLPENYAPSFFVDLYQRFPNTFYVCEVDGRVVGYIMCRIEFGRSEFEEFSLIRKGHIVSIAVLPEYRRRGFGTSLLKAALSGMVEYGAREAFLEVRVSNTPAIGLYRKLGFEIRRVERRYYIDGEDAYVMARKLPLEQTAI